MPSRSSRPTLVRVVPTVLLAVLALLLGGLAPAYAAGVVSGKVTDGSLSSAPGLAGATVTLIPQGTTGGSDLSDTTDANGLFEFTGVPAGAYAVRYSLTGYTTEFFDNAPTQDTDTPISLTAGSDRTGLDAALSDTGNNDLGGTVTNASGAPVQGVTVDVLARSVVSGGTGAVSIAETPTATATTAPDGTWSRRLPVGSYVVRYSAPAFQTAFYRSGSTNGTTTATDASEVQAKGTAIPGLDVRLTTNSGVVFTGRVVSAADPVSGVQVRVEYPVTQASGQVTQVLATSATTAANGTYSATAPTAAGREYRVSYVAEGFPTVFYPAADVGTTTPGTEERALARRFPADAPVSNALVDVALTAQTAVTGTVRTVAGAPLSGVAVTPVVYTPGPDGSAGTWGANTDVATSDTTDADGVYKVLVGAEDTPFRLEFSRAGRTTTYFPSATVADEGANLTVAENQTLTGRDVVLPTLSVLSGTVTEPNGSAYTGTGTLSLLRRVTYTELGEQGGPSHTEWRTVASKSLTSGSSSFTVPAGSYRVRLDGSGLGEAGFFPGLVGLDQAATVVVGTEQTLAGQSFALPGKQLVQGAVTDSAGTGIEGARVNPAYRFVEDVVDGAPVLSEVINASTQPQTASDGSYSVSVRQRTYRVQAVRTTPAGDRFFPDAETFADADDVVVADNPVTGIDIQLAGGAARNIHLPWIAGVNQEGQTLTANPGTWSRSDLTFTYQWLGKNANGAYTELADETGQTLDIPTALPLPIPGLPAPFDSYQVEVTAILAGTPPTTTTAFSPGTGQTATQFGGSPDIENRQLPIVTGKAAVGETLTGTDGQWSKTGTYTYQWFAAGQAIAGATSRTLVLTGAQLGKKVRLRVTETSGSTPAGGEVVESAETVTVVAGALRNTVAPTVTGEPKVGKTLTATPGTWSVASPTFAYQWLANGQVIPGATTTTYVPVAADAGKSLVVRVTASSPGFAPGVASSEPTAAVGTDPLVNNALPTVSGSPTVGGTLTATNGTWTPVPTSFAYQWLADGTAIAGATAASYSPVAGDVGKRLSVRVVASRAGNSDGTATSAQTVAVTRSDFTNTALPVVSGTPAAGSTLSTTNGSWTPTPTSFAYQWLADGTPIAGATAATFTPIAANAGRRISVTVTARTPGLNDGSATSLQTAPVTVPEEGVVVGSGPRTSGTPRLGNVLVANAGSFTPSSARVAFQWLRSGVVIPGETDGTYAVGTRDLGQRLSVRVTYTAGGSDPVVRTSAQTAVAKTTAVISSRVVSQKRPLQLNVAVRADGANPVRGTVRVLSDGAVVARGTLTEGRVLLRLRGLDTGRQVVTIVYGGEARVLQDRVQRQVSVRR